MFYTPGKWKSLAHLSIGGDLELETSCFMLCFVCEALSVSSFGKKLRERDYLQSDKEKLNILWEMSIPLGIPEGSHEAY